MSSTVRYGAVITIVAGGLLSSCAGSSRTAAADPPVFVDAVPPININFTCGNANQGIAVTLLDNNNNPAWSFSAHKNDPVSWVAPDNVTINEIKSKSPGIPLPLTVDPGGSSHAYKAHVNGGAQPNHYLYSIDVTCTPAAGGGPPVRLVIDPEMIIL